PDKGNLREGVDRREKTSAHPRGTSERRRAETVGSGVVCKGPQRRKRGKKKFKWQNKELKAWSAEHGEGPATPSG
ncbi:hypothetical protein HAX54_029067, partial [Datura stramonium]|nr:hypothetical protein [Datura stramonium]